VYAAITAGGCVDPEFAKAIGTDVKALAPLGNRLVIDAAIDAARELGVAGIAVVGGEQVRAHCAHRVDRFIDASGDGVENIRLALGAFDFDRLVYLTSDLPFVTGPDLAAFVTASSGAQLAMPLAEAKAYERAYPFSPTPTMALGGERFANGSAFVIDRAALGPLETLAGQFLPLAEAKAYERAYPFSPTPTMALGGERFANGSAFVIDRAALGPLETLAGQFFAARKSLPRLAMLLGPALVFRFVTKQLRIGDIETRARTVFNLDARAIRGAAPSLCYDIDTIADWEYAAQLARSTYV